MTNYKTFYANSIEGCVSCGQDDLPQGGNWIVSSNADDVLGWLHDLGSDTEFFKVTQNVLDAVASVFGIQ